MLHFILRRFLLTIPTFIGITILTFALIRFIPGDPIEVIMGERGISAEVHAQMKQELSLDKPIYIQYINYLTDIADGNFGKSYKSNQLVVDEFLSLFPATLELSLISMLLAIIIGIPIGVFAAIKKGSVFDHTVMATALTGYSIPTFWFALLLILFFSIDLDLTPVSGRIGAEFWFDTPTGFMLIDSLLSGENGAFKSAVMHLILPTIVLCSVPLVIICRMTRASMLKVLDQDYIRTAKAKGVSTIRVIFVHALRNALIPIITVVGLILGSLLSGAIVTETIFGWPGIGKWVMEAINARDYPVVQGAILIIAIMIIVINFIMDILYSVINPRISYSQ